MWGKAINGSVITGNGDKWCSSAATKFLQVDLGAPTILSKFVVQHAGAGGETPVFNTRDFNIQLSSDGSTFTTVTAVPSNTASTTTHPIATTTARYVRLNVTTPTQNGCRNVPAAAATGWAGPW